MIIRQAEIQKFGKLEKEQYRFSPQINIIYGPNESGKSTLMQFLKAMMYGLEKSRVRKMLDTYKKYEPWDAPAYFSGSMIFETGEQQFLLERNFYYKERSTRLVNIRDGEELSVEYGDLDMLLGNVSAGAYENTFCIGQEQSVPGRELGVLLEDERSNLAQTGSGDFPLSKALQNLEQKRKNKEKQKKELEQQRLADIRQLEVKQQMLESDIAVLKAQQKKQGTQKQNVQEQVKQLKQAAEPVLSEYRAVCRQEQELQKVIRQAQLNIERKHLKKEHLKKETEDGQKQKTEHQAGFSPLLLIGVAGLILAPILRTSLDGFQKIAPILNVICIVLILAGLISAYGRRRRLQEVEMEAEAIQEGAEAECGDEEVYQKVVKQLTALQQKRSVLEQQIDTFREQRKALTDAGCKAGRFRRSDHWSDSGKRSGSSESGRSDAGIAVSDGRGEGDRSGYSGAYTVSGYDAATGSRNVEIAGTCAEPGHVGDLGTDHWKCTWAASGFRRTGHCTV